MRVKPFVEYTGGPLLFNDNFFADEEEMFDYHDDVDVFADAELCDKEILGYQDCPASLLEDIVERITDEVEEPERMDVQGKQELLAALKTFLDAQTQVLFVPNGKFVRLERPKEES